MQAIKKWIRRLIISIPVLAVLLMALQIRNVPDYRSGRSYVSYSPDGRYRLDHVFPKKGNDVQIFYSLKENSVIAIVPTPPWIEGGAFTSIWLCSDDDSECYHHDIQTSDGVPVDLPPSGWRRLHAWLTIKLKGLENPKLKIVEISTRYPPVTKK